VLDQHRTNAEVARELGVNEQTLGNWVRQERIDSGERETNGGAGMAQYRVSARNGSTAVSARVSPALSARSSLACAASSSSSPWNASCS